jgi:hypothetical protein
MAIIAGLWRARVRICALMLEQMTGYDALDIFSVPSTPVDT